MIGANMDMDIATMAKKPSAGEKVCDSNVPIPATSRPIATITPAMGIAIAMTSWISKYWAMGCKGDTRATCLKPCLENVC